MPRFNGVPGATEEQKKPRFGANDSDFAGLITGKPKKPYMRKLSESLAGAVGGSPQVADAPDAIQHRGLDAFHGTAQLLQHGLGKVGLMSPETIAQDDAAIARREADYQKYNGNTAGGYIGSAVGSVAPWMYGVGVTCPH